MADTKSYCEAVASGNLHPVHKAYHDFQYGFPVEDDNELFARLVLELNQAGLSWETILKKQKGFYEAYDNFDVLKVAQYGVQDRERLRNDPRIIRNRLKINAAIHNAGVIKQLRKEYGSFKNWLDHHHPLAKPDWIKLFKKHFKFTGAEITNEFLMSTGYLKGAHVEGCPIHKEILKMNPPWIEIKS